MNEKVRDDIRKMRLLLNEARILCVNLLYTPEYDDLSDAERDKLTLAMKHRARCDDRLYELVKRIGWSSRIKR